jgi:hypothetical protein
MSTHNHAVVWTDHRIAKIFFLGLNEADVQKVEAHLPSGHLHHKANTVGDGRAGDDPTFLRRIDEALQGSERILVVGPGTAPATLVHHLGAGHAPTKQRSIEIKSCDHPSDREIIALGRHHFHLGEPAR